jgi:excisionase family DNA binding protein
VEQELWESVSYGTNYQVSSLGQVRNTKTGKLLSGWVNEDDYRRVTLSDGDEKKSFYVHLLVAEAFIGPCPPGQQVRHWDGDSLNNRRDNLLHGTPKENCEDRDKRHGRNGHANKTRCGTCGLPYDEANTYVYPEGSHQAGARACRNCIRASGQRWDERNPGRRAAHKRERRRKRREERSEVFLTTGEAADLLGVTTETIRRWCKQGILESERPKTSHLLVYRASAEALADSRLLAGLCGRLGPGLIAGFRLRFPGALRRHAAGLQLMRQVVPLQHHTASRDGRDQASRRGGHVIHPARLDGEGGTGLEVQVVGEGAGVRALVADEGHKASGG